MARSANDLLREAAATRSYTTPAIVTLVLYFVLWFPGAIANVLYLRSAKRDAALIGVKPSGMGFLRFMFWVFLVLPLIAGLLITLGVMSAAMHH